LEGIDLSGVHTILDLGCGFGFFTEALKGRTARGSTILGIDKFQENRSRYMGACDKAGIPGSFVGDGIDHIKTLESDSFDLIICSYALYFFPDYIQEIARVLKDDGLFVTITHARPHMIEFTSFVKASFDKNQVELNDDLPFNILIEEFSDLNGKPLLSESFNDIREIPYMNKMVFEKDDYAEFSTYLCFKRPSSLTFLCHPNVAMKTRYVIFCYLR